MRFSGRYLRGAEYESREKEVTGKKEAAEAPSC